MDSEEPSAVAAPGERRWKVQGARYAVVGLLSNVVLYLVYLALTVAGVGHKKSVTLLYVVGALFTFLFNRFWTFGHAGAVRHSMVRYLMAYIGAYVANLGALYLFVDRFGLPHAAVQGIAIFAIAALLFLLQRFWVFAPERYRGLTVAGPT